MSNNLDFNQKIIRLQIALFIIYCIEILVYCISKFKDVHKILYNFIKKCFTN